MNLIISSVASVKHCLSIILPFQSQETRVLFSRCGPLCMVRVLNVAESFFSSG